MAIVSIQNFIICSLMIVAGANLHGQGSLRKSPKVHTDAIQKELASVLSEVLGHGHSVTEDRLKRINSILMPLFRSLPKNNLGHVSAPIMRYTMRRYFRATRAWMMKGFDEHGDYAFNARNVSDPKISQRDVPSFVWSVLEQKFAHQGFSQHDMASMIAVLESLSFNGVVNSVEVGFRLNFLESGAIISEAEVKDVLASFLVMEVLEGNGFIPNPEQQARFKKDPYGIYPKWAETFAFLSDITGSDALSRRGNSNPFTAKTFAFEDVVRMAERITEEWGPWNNYECLEMKKVLSELDVHGTGRVMLGDFYKVSKDENDGEWMFLEPPEYLRELGALDESSNLGKQVIIPNYVTGLSNCVSGTLYFSITCISECESIQHHIESEIQYPKGTISQILEAVESLPAPPLIPQRLMKLLEEIAAINGGSIPLHGRLLAQWLHFVFPRDCPYPHEVGSISPRLAKRDGSDLVGEAELMQHIQYANASRHLSPDAEYGMWSSQESIMDSSTPSDTDDAMSSKVFRVISQLVMTAAFAAFLVQEGMKIFRSFHGAAKEKEFTV